MYCFSIVVSESKERTTIVSLNTCRLTCAVTLNSSTQALETEKYICCIDILHTKINKKTPLMLPLIGNVRKFIDFLSIFKNCLRDFIIINNWLRMFLSCTNVIYNHLSVEGCEDLMIRREDQSMRWKSLQINYCIK